MVALPSTCVGSHHILNVKEGLIRLPVQVFARNFFTEVNQRAKKNKPLHLISMLDPELCSWRKYFFSYYCYFLQLKPNWNSESLFFFPLQTGNNYQIIPCRAW